MQFALDNALSFIWSKYGLKICILLKGVYYMNSYTAKTCAHEMA